VFALQPSGHAHRRRLSKPATGIHEFVAVCRDKLGRAALSRRSSLLAGSYWEEGKSLIRHVEHGGQLRSHDDVPEDIRQQIYAEDQKRLEKHQRATKISSSNLPLINITNVLPGPSHQEFMSALLMADQPPPITPLSIPGLRGATGKEYSNW
jgi:hypothetical protein